jgi:hypothetical protein
LDVAVGVEEDRSSSPSGFIVRWGWRLSDEWEEDGRRWRRGIGLVEGNMSFALVICFDLCLNRRRSCKSDRERQVRRSKRRIGEDGWRGKKPIGPISTIRANAEKPSLSRERGSWLLGGV